MLKPISIILLCNIVRLCTADYCQDNFTIGEFPKGVLLDTITLFTKGAFESIVKCPKDVYIEPNNIRFWLWTKNNSDTPINLDHQAPTGIQKNQKVIFLIHGWLCNITSDRMPQLKDAYLQRYPESNVIGVEWATYSVDLYATAFCSIPKIVPIIGEFICKLNTEYSIDIDDIRLVGHSMGGQISGLAGQEVKRICKKTVGRITALDPAGPLFQTTLDNKRRLDASDAKIVDVIHTNQGLAGFYGACGTVDYFPNCGYFQPGCLKVTDALNTSSLLDKPLSYIGCSHLRSLDYLIESISSDQFVAHSCSGCPGLPIVGPCLPDLFRSSSSVMGEDYPDHPGSSHKYLLSTNSKPPFAKSTNSKSPFM